MKSLQIQEPFNIRWVETAEPRLEPGTVLVKPEFGGVCGSDLAAYRGQSWYVSYPRVIGHELAAMVVAVGEGVEAVTPGMRVTALPYFNCGRCRGCRRGKPNACINNETMGVQRDGGFADLVRLPIDHVFSGEGVEPRALALVEPFAISYHGVRQAAVEAGDKVLVMGAGTIGILAAVAAQSMGAEAYIADVAPAKVQRAVTDYGLAGGLHIDSPDAVAGLVDSATAGEGFDVVVEAAGAPESFVSALEAAGSLGRVSVIGISTRNAEFNASHIQRKELSIIGSRGATRQDFRDVLDLVRADYIDLTTVIDRQYSAADAAVAFEELDRDSAEITKAIFEF